MRHRLAIAVAIALSSALSAVADAQSTEPAVALVLEVRGETQPPLKPYHEVHAGDKVVLDRRTTLVVLHYDRTCRTITIEGGSVRFPKRGEPDVQGGVSSARDGKCLRRLEARSTAGAIVMRGAAAKISTNPAFIIGGTRGSQVGKMRVLEDDRVVFESPVNSPQFHWPMTATGLPVNQHYVIEFLARDGSGVLASLPVYTSDTPSENESGALIVID